MSANVTIITACRDIEPHFATYLDSLAGLDYPPTSLRFVAVEGDSIDESWAALASWRAADSRVTLVKCDCNTPRFGSIIHPERFRTLATVFNAGLDAVDWAWSDYAMMLPSDIRYSGSLLAQLIAADKDIIAPFIYDHGLFYDVWGFTLRDSFIGQLTEEQIHDLFGVEPVALDSVGSVVLLRRAVLTAGVRYGVAEVDRDLCRDARKLGFGVFGHPGVSVYHGNGRRK